MGTKTKQARAAAHHKAEHVGAVHERHADPAGRRPAPKRPARLPVAVAAASRGRVNGPTEAHLRVVRPRRRRSHVPGVGKIERVQTLCGKWETPGHVVREDRRRLGSAPTCRACIARMVETSDGAES